MKDTKPRAYSSKELAGLYGIGYDAFRSWLEPFKKEIGKQKGKAWNPKQVAIIFDRLGEP